MATLSAPALVGIYKAIEASPQYNSMRRGGIVGDLAHKRRGGYHVSRSDQPSTNYSVQAPADKRGPSNLASGIDLTMGPADMRRMGDRLWAACVKNRRDPGSEPRIEPVREWFGKRSGVSGVSGYNRYPSANRRVGPSSSDSSHEWHTHISIFRDYADDPAKIKGVIDILLGVPLDQPDPPKPPTPPTPKPDEEEDDDMPTANEIASAILTAKIGTRELPDWTLRHLIDWTARTTLAQGKVLAQIASGQKVTQKELDEIQASLAELDEEPVEEPPEVLAAQSAADGEDARPEELKQ